MVELVKTTTKKDFVGRDGKTHNYIRTNLYLKIDNRLVPISVKQIGDKKSDIIKAYHDEQSLLMVATDYKK